MVLDPQLFPIGTVDGVSVPVFGPAPAGVQALPRARAYSVSIASVRRRRFPSVSLSESVP